MIYALDIETRSLTDDPDDALIPHLSEITVIGAWAPNDKAIYFESVEEFNRFMKKFPDSLFVGHNLKFDLRHLIAKGAHIHDAHWVDDTQLMASVLMEKIPKIWLDKYEEKRREKNKQCKPGYTHRTASPHSLKTLAPYFLKVPAFWEDPSNHADPSYCLKDCEYTYRLWELFSEKLKEEGGEKFYRNRLLPWTKLLLRSELRGVAIDLDKMHKQEQLKNKKREELKRFLDETWKEAHKEYYDAQRQALGIRYAQMAAKYKMSHPKLSEDRCRERYQELLNKAISKLEYGINYDSSEQMRWFLKDYSKLNIKNFHDKDSSGREVLNRLASEGREDIQSFLEYRKVNKLLTSFYPTYKKLQVNGRIHCQFNPTGTRTGRLSSSRPNLQQVAGELHGLFRASEECQLITRDMSAIEPRLAAYYTEDKNLCELIIRGGDFHSRNAIVMFGLTCDESEVKEKFPKERHLAKTCGLALLYGAGPTRIRQTALQQGWRWNRAKCEQIYERFHRYYKQAFIWKSRFDEQAKTKPVLNLFGRQHSYPNPDDIHMKAFNRLIQSSASDLVLNSAYRFWTNTEAGLPVLYVHDEIVVESRANLVKQNEELLEKCMTEYTLQTKHGKIPLEVEGTTGKYWEK